jgi:hypothetical protein
VAGLHIKQGATLQLLLAMTNSDGSAYDFTGMTITAQVRTKGALALVASLTVVVTGTPGQLSISQATDGWATGPLVMDLKFAKAGVVLKSDTVDLLVDQAVTA